MKRKRLKIAILLTLSVLVSIMLAGPLIASQATESPVIGGYSIPYTGGIS